jgi:hypothetical protein
MKPYGIWYTKDVTEELLKSRRNDPVLLRLIQLTKQRIEDIKASERREQSYENASWAYLQSHRNGRAQELDYLLNLLSFCGDQNAK